MNLIQFLTPAGSTAVAAIGEGRARQVRNAESVYQLASEAIAQSTTLAGVIGAHGFAEAVEVNALAEEGRLLPPIAHPDPAHLYLTGTGLTHLGSASTRDAMHQKAGEADRESLTDSMKMFRMGLENGKPGPGETGVQPEWFYKGNGDVLVAPGQPIPSPAFAGDAGEEPEIAGIYLVGPDGRPYRLGFALANEFSDHVTERVNYLWLAHSKLRACSIGPELRIGDLPADIHGTSRILRDGKLVWQKPFLSGEDNMSHTIANLEYHHFKYGLFRHPGDVHVHMFGTATLSFADNVRTEDGDVFEIEATEHFGAPLRNPVEFEAGETVTVAPLY